MRQRGEVNARLSESRPLSKSKLMAYRQCHRRLWLEVHRPELREDSGASQARFDAGYRVGEVARQIYDPRGRGVLVDLGSDGVERALARSAELVAQKQPIFEAGFSADGALAFADVMLPVTRNGAPAWRIVEVKSSTAVKDYHLDDVAVQALVVREAGVPLASVSIAHIDSDWTYPGNGDYRGLLVEENVTKQSKERADEVRAWIAQAHAITRRPGEPDVVPGSHCSSPFECGFLGHCTSQIPQAEHPVAWLPRVQKRELKKHLAHPGITELADVPDGLLTPLQLRVKTHTLDGTTYFDRTATKRALQPHGLPAYFLDFETIQFAVPIWAGTRPYQQIPFQFSVHGLSRSGRLSHADFLDLSGDDPSQALARVLVAACGDQGVIYAYNASFERACVESLAERHRSMRRALRAIAKRLVDLLPLAQSHFYHPRQQGGWSIKKVLPAIAPDLDYDQLDGVHDGGMAMDAYLEAIAAATPQDRREALRSQLLAYCKLDTLAIVRLWEVFSGRRDLAA